MSDKLNFQKVPFDTLYNENLAKKPGAVLIECEPTRTVLKIIEECIVDNNTVLTNAELANWILRYYVARTENHIEKVKICATYLKEFFQFGGYYDRFITKVQQHDFDKFSGNEHVAFYALASPLYTYEDLYTITPEARKVYEEIEWPKHYEVNDHHPEHYMHKVDDVWVASDEEVEEFFKNKGGHPGALMALGEMVADWMAVGIEMGDTAKAWWLKNKDKKWSFGPTYTQVVDTLVAFSDIKIAYDVAKPIPEPPEKKVEAQSPQTSESSTESLDTSCADRDEIPGNESLTITSKNPDVTKLITTAKQYYPEVGQNSWQHISLVCSQGQRFVKDKNRELTLVEWAALLFHDCSVMGSKDKSKHDVESAKLATEKILPKLKLFTDAELDAIYTAIAEHDGNKHTTDLSNLLASADTNPPDVGWILNKSYSWGIKQGLTHEQRIKNLLAHVPRVYGSKGTYVFATYYKEHYSKKITEMQQVFDRLTYAQAEYIIDYFRKEHGLKDGDVDLPEISVEALDYSQEAQQPQGLSKIAQKKKKILDFICKLCDTMEPTGLNSKRYRQIIGNMTDKEFDQFMNYMKAGKWQLHLVAPNMVVNLKNENLLKAADLIGLNLFHRIWMNDPATGRRYLTDNEYMIIKLPIRRQQQFLDEKLSVPDNDKTIDGLTGQVTGDSRACSITNPEIQILAARKLNSTLRELVNIRGGNIYGYNEFKRMLEENGEADLDMIDPNSRTRASVVGGVLLKSMMIDTNL